MKQEIIVFILISNHHCVLDTKETRLETQLSSRDVSDSKFMGKSMFSFSTTRSNIFILYI